MGEQKICLSEDILEYKKLKWKSSKRTRVKVVEKQRVGTRISFAAGGEIIKTLNYFYMFLYHEKCLHDQLVV